MYTRFNNKRKVTLYLNVRNLIEFNTTKLDKVKFFNIINNFLKKEMFISIEKIVFVNSEDEIDLLLEDYLSQFFDIDKNLGMHWYMDNIIIINVALCEKVARESADEIYSFKEEFNRAILETFIHELRHAECSNPIIPTYLISEEDATEKGVEDYCRKIFSKITKETDYICFY